MARVPAPESCGAWGRPRGQCQHEGGLGQSPLLPRAPPQGSPETCHPSWALTSSPRQTEFISGDVKKRESAFAGILGNCPKPGGPTPEHAQLPSPACGAFTVPGGPPRAPTRAHTHRSVLKPFISECQIAIINHY